MPQACTLMRTCPAPGVGISRSTISKSAPGLETCATFIGATFGAAAALIVDISPPEKLLFGFCYTAWDSVIGPVLRHSRLHFFQHSWQCLHGKREAFPLRGK